MVRKGLNGQLFYDNIISISDGVQEEEEKFGTLICSELSAPHGDFESKSRKKSCMQMIGDCAAISMKYIQEAEQQGK